MRTPRFEPRVFDVALTVLLLAGGLVGLFFYPGAGVDDAVDYLPGDALGVFLVVLTTAPLALRRRAPILAGAVVTLGVLAFLVWNYAVPTATVVMVIATYSAAAYAGFAVSLALVAAMTEIGRAHV